jgi:anti-anti-sigma factor
MDIMKNLTQGSYDVTFVGKFTFSDHTAFREVLEKIADKDVLRVTFHMEKMDFIDSTGLGMLLLALDATEDNHKPLIISGAVGQVKKMFELAKFNTLFTMG